MSDIENQDHEERREGVIDETLADMDQGWHRIERSGA